MAKLLKLRRGSTSQHSSFTGAEGEVTIDTTKDTAVVHDGAQAGGRPLAREDMSNVSSASIAGQLGTDSIAVGKIAAGTLPSDVKVTDSNVSGNLTIESADIVNGTIVNADVNASAAIAGSKITPDFASQQITTTGKIQTSGEVEAGSLDINGTTSPVQIDHTGGAAVSMNRSGKNLTFNANYGAANTHSQIDTNCTDLRLATAGSDRLAVNSSGASVTGNLDVSNGADVTGNITVTGTVDGRDVAADGSKLDGIDSGAKDDQTKAEIDALNINADQVDGLHASQFLRSDQAVTTGSHFTVNGQLTVGQGTSSDIYMVDTDETTRRIHTNSNRIGFLTSASAWGCYADNSGNWVAAGNVTAYSDARLKTDISTINDALGIVGKLRGVSYKWLKDGSDSIGLIAQEVEEVLPEVVVTGEGVNPVTQEIEEIKSVDYGKIVGVLINAINELNTKLEAQESYFLGELEKHKSGGH